MTCDKRFNFSTTSNTFNFTANGRPRLFSTPEKQDLETIYENEANATSGNVDQTDVDRSQSSNKTNSDLTSKRARLQAAISSRTNASDKKTSTPVNNSVGAFSHPTNNTSGPGGGGNNAAASVSATSNVSRDGYDQRNIVASLAPHANAAVPVTSLGSPSKSQATNSTASSASKKDGSSRRIRSSSKPDSQSVSDKSLFQRIFSKRPKKPLGSLITTTTKAIDLSMRKKRTNLIAQSSLTKPSPGSTIDEEDENNNYANDDDPNISTGSLSDTDNFDEKDDTMNTSLSSSTTLGSNRVNSGNEKKSNTTRNYMTLPASDSQYYASMSSAPTGFSISYHKYPTKDNQDLRKQVTIGRYQKQNKTGTDGGAAELMSIFQDPNRSGAQSPSSMSGTTRVKTLSGQTIITRTSSSSDRPATYCIRQSVSSPTVDAEEAFISDDEIYTHFMKFNTCYDIMPKSSKLVIFDTQLAVKKAFFALVYNGVRAAPLWDNKRQRFIGLLTITDFILILQKYYREPHAKIEELEDHRIETWREVLREYERPLLCIKPDQSLFDAIRILLENRVHRLPIVDPITHNVIFILTHKRILRFFSLYIYDWPQPGFMSKSVEELKIGTYDNLHIIDEHTTVIEALHYFVEYRVSALPVVDKNRRLVNIYSKFDVIGLAPDKSYRNLNITISEALSYRKDRFETVAKCYKHELLSTCMERIVKAEVHRLVIVDNDEHVIGILSLSDLLYYIVIRPTKVTQEMRTETETTTNTVSPTAESDQKIE